jgi:hypothetical protein
MRTLAQAHRLAVLDHRRERLAVRRVGDQSGNAPAAPRWPRRPTAVPSMRAPSGSR